MTRQFSRSLVFLTVIVVMTTGLSLGLPFDQPSRAETRPYPPFNRKLTSAEKRWVARTIAGMSLDEKIGQLVSTDANAIFFNRDSDQYRRLERHIVAKKVGTIILFRSDVWASAVLLNRLQQLARVPLLVSADLEMGPGMRFDDTVWWAPNMAVGATGDVTFARVQGQATALEARAIGINWLYAPVADVNNNPNNPVINTRSFGEDPRVVGDFVRAFVEGAQNAGVLATAKHFPGHGDTATDSHIGLPVVDVSRERLEKIELVPFRAAIAGGVGSIMSAHIALPQIEPEFSPPLRTLSDKEREASEFVSLTESNSPRVTLPGTLSSRVMTKLLRDDLGFQGVATTDAMSMAGVAARFDSGTAAVRAIKAGADIVLKAPDVDAAIEAIKAAVKLGEITESRVDESVRRILHAKAALGLNARRLVDLNDVDRIVSSVGSQKIAQDIADRSITLVRDERKVLPYNIQRHTRVLNVTLTDDEDRTILAPFLGELRRGASRIESIIIDSRSRFVDDERVRLRKQLAESDLVILSIVVRARSGKGSVALPPVGEGFLTEITAAKAPLITVSFGNPYLLQELPAVPLYLAAYSVVPVSQRAAARAILGEIEISGRLPVSLPGLYPIGHGLRVARR